MGHNKEMISTLCPIPVRPRCGDELNCASHHPGGLEGQGKPSGGKVARRVYRCIEPVSLLGIESPNRTG